MNIIQILGRVGRDPKTFTTNSGMKIVSFSVATTERWTKNNETQTRTTWHNIKIFGKIAEIAAERVTKGCEVFIVGQMAYGEYEKEGAKVKTADVHIQGPQHLFRVISGGAASDGDEDDGEAPPQRQSGRRPPPPQREDHSEGGVKLDDEIPF
jgi:single-strand DNA-binding protein